MATSSALNRAGHQMIRTGGLGALAGLVVVAIVGWAIAGWAAGLAGGLGAILAGLVLTGGLWGLVLMSEPVKAMTMALVGYIGGLVLFGAGLWALRRLGPGLPGLWLGVGAAAAAAGFMIGTIVAHTRARVPLTEPVPPPAASPATDDEPGKLQPHE